MLGCLGVSEEISCYYMEMGWFVKRECLWRLSDVLEELGDVRFVAERTRQAKGWADNSPRPWAWRPRPQHCSCQWNSSELWPQVLGSHGWWPGCRRFYRSRFSSRCLREEEPERQMLSQIYASISHTHCVCSKCPSPPYNHMPPFQIAP